MQQPRSRNGNETLSQSVASVCLRTDRWAHRRCQRSAVGVGRMSDVCRIASLCHVNITSRCPSLADNEAASSSLSPQLTAAGTNGVALTPPPGPSTRACFSFDSRTKANQLVTQQPRDQDHPPDRLVWGGGHCCCTVRLEPQTLLPPHLYPAIWLSAESSFATEDLKR